MKIKFLVGSCYFFSEYPDFNPSDKDYVILVDKGDGFNYYRGTHYDGYDIFEIVRRPLTEYLNWLDNVKHVIKVCCFFNPEFNKEMGFTIDMLPRLKPLVDKLRKKHEYYKVIYDAYIENQSFTLTQEQRDRVYSSYKKARIRE